MSNFFICSIHFFTIFKKLFLQQTMSGITSAYWIFCNVKEIVKIKREKLDHRGNNRIYTPYSIYRAFSSFETSDVDVTKQLLQFWFCSSLKYYLIITAFMRFREIKLNGMGNVLKIHSGFWVDNKITNQIYSKFFDENMFSYKLLCKKKNS